MKFKPVPPAPEDFGFVERAQQAVPLVPDSEADCCARLLDRLDLSTRDEARTWLTFLRALELVTETPSGFRRIETTPTVSDCHAALLERVVAAEEVYDALAAEPLTAAEAFEAIRDEVPTWERHSDPSWESAWRERVAALLDWFVLLDAAERVGDGRFRSR